MTHSEDLSVRLASLSPAKREWLELKLQQKRTERTTGVTIPRRSTHAAIPLSFAQQRLWFLNQLEPESCTYNEASALRLDGELNINALQGALNTIAERHEVLRTTYALADNGVPVQILMAVRAVDVPVLDISEVTRTQQDVQVQRLALELKTRPFDLINDLPLRLALIRLSPISHVLVAVIHHIASDGWSRGVFSRELASLYNSVSQGRPNPLSGLPVQYADYAVWQREWLQGEVLEKQLAYWKGQLEDVPTLNLPTDRPRGGLAKDSGAKKTLTLPKTLIDRLKALSSQQGATLFMTLLAAFQVLLHRYTGQDDIAVGSPIAGRTRTETEGLIGFFVNTLVLRTKLSGDPTFKELLSRVRITALQAYEHQDLPFEKLVEELNPERSQSQTPLFQVSLAVQNVPQSNLDIPELKVTPVEINSSTAKFDLAAAFIEHEREMTVRIEYRRELFEAATIERMFGHFERLLEGIVANPEQRISKLPLLNDAEKHQLLVKWNDTRAEYPKDQSIHELFEEQVERTPEAVAVVYEDQQMTYRELNQKANQLAHYLGERGVRAEALIAVFMERSLEMVIAILGVLKAGGAYVPIDPDTPTDRLKFMLQDTQTPLILTQERFSSYLEEFVDQRICLDSAWEELSRESQENPKSQVDGETAAYTIYTSGSTGTPKGVINVHGGLRNRLQWMQESYQLTAADRVLQKTPFTFDVSVWEFFWPLISGATLVIARPGGHRDSAYLLQVIQSKRITTMHFVPSMLGVFLQEAGVENCPSLKRVFCSGEALSYELQQLFFERIGAPLHNLYGPTEASIDVTAWKCRGDRDRTVVPIGRPIANTQVYILDQYLAPVPIGVVGEIHIGGLGLARGYLNQPELMAEKFIYRSFEGEPARRLYKTGDLARYLPDGNIEFIGRMDDQVKIRGYRIELGEIEAVLVQHPMVQSSVVVVREDEPGDKRLVGYVVARLKETFDAAEVRQYLKHKLPEYLIPAALVLLDELPLTPSGKVDRRALPAPDQNGLQLANVYQPPRTPTEETLVTIWGKVLKLDKVGIYDNFFDVGGHSLLGTQVMSRIRSAFSIDLPLRHMFESPTVAEMADVITQSQWKQASEAELAQLLGEVEATTEEDAQKMLTT